MTKGRWTVAVVLILALVLTLALLVLYGRGGGPLPGWLDFLSPADASLLDPSGPEEAALRTLRLAGYDQAAVGEDGGTVVVRLEAPEVRSPADVELTWQTAIGTAAATFPDASSYVAQVFSDDIALLEVRVDAGDLRDAIGDGEDAGAFIKESGEIILLAGDGVSG